MAHWDSLDRAAQFFESGAARNERRQLETGLAGHTKLGLLMVDYNYRPTRGDADSPATFPLLHVEREVVEGWTFEASQRGIVNGLWPASEIRLRKADGSPDEVGMKNWAEVPNRSWYYQVDKKLQDGYYDKEDYGKGTVMRYPSLVGHWKMVRAVRELERKGVTALAADSGFSMQFQGAVAEMTDVPVGLSSLMQLPWIVNTRGRQEMLKQKQKILLLTANGESFKKDMESILPAGVERALVHVVGLENTEFGKWVARGASFRRFISKALGDASVQAAMVGICTEVEKHIEELQKRKCRPVAILSECTELPSYTNILRYTFKIPVFDVITSIQWMTSGTGFGKYSADMIPFAHILPRDIDCSTKKVPVTPLWSEDLMHQVKQLDAHVLPFEQEGPKLRNIVSLFVNALIKKMRKIWQLRTSSRR